MEDVDVSPWPELKSPATPDPGRREVAYSPSSPAARSTSGSPRAAPTGSRVRATISDSSIPHGRPDLPRSSRPLRALVAAALLTGSHGGRVQPRLQRHTIARENRDRPGEPTHQELITSPDRSYTSLTTHQRRGTATGRTKELLRSARMAPTSREEVGAGRLPRGALRHQGCPHDQGRSEQLLRARCLRLLRGRCLRLLRCGCLGLAWWWAPWLVSVPSAGCVGGGCLVGSFVRGCLRGGCFVVGAFGRTVVGAVGLVVAGAFGRTEVGAVGLVVAGAFGRPWSVPSAWWWQVPSAPALVAGAGRGTVVAGAFGATGTVVAGAFGATRHGRHDRLIRQQPVRGGPGPADSFPRSESDPRS